MFLFFSAANFHVFFKSIIIFENSVAFKFSLIWMKDLKFIAVEESSHLPCRPYLLKEQCQKEKTDLGEC